MPQSLHANTGTTLRPAPPVATLKEATHGRETHSRRLPLGDAVPHPRRRHARARVLQEGASAPSSCCACPLPAARSATPRSGSAIRRSCSPTNPRRWARAARARIGGSPISLMVYVEDVDAQVAQAVAAGAKLVAAGRRTSSTATAPAASTIRSATTGTSPPTSRTSRRTSSSGARRRRWAERRG